MPSKEATPLDDSNGGSVACEEREESLLCCKLDDTVGEPCALTLAERVSRGDADTLPVLDRERVLRVLVDADGEKEEALVILEVALAQPLTVAPIDGAGESLGGGDGERDGGCEPAAVLDIVAPLSVG